MKNIAAYLKANKGPIIRRAAIAAAVITTVVVVGALYKNAVLEDDSILLAENPDGSFTVTENPAV